MQKQTENSGIYVLEILVSKRLKLNHKIFSEKNFPKGYYYYIGSAQKNLHKRIQRHIKKTKKLHWHIDYLTSIKEILITNVFIIPNFKKENECKLVGQLENVFGLEHKIIGFGNSDCNECKSHLLYIKEKISYNQLCSLYQSTVLFIPSSSEIS